MICDQSETFEPVKSDNGQDAPQPTSLLDLHPPTLA